MLAVKPMETLQEINSLQSLVNDIESIMHDDEFKCYPLTDGSFCWSKTDEGFGKLYFLKLKLMTLVKPYIANQSILSRMGYPVEKSNGDSYLLHTPKGIITF